MKKKKIIVQKSDIEDIYSLSPMQEGILFHHLMDEKSTAYFHQSTFTISGEIDFESFEKSFNFIIKRYDVLRTVFIYKKVIKPKQVLLKNRNARVYFKDISGLAEHEKERFIEEFKRKDRGRRFNLRKDILMKISIIKSDNQRYYIILSYHHIIIDGWCLGIIYKELMQVYQLLQQGKEVKLEPLTPYRRYIKWLEGQNKEEGLSYWKELIEGFDQKAVLPKKVILSTDNGYKLGEYSFLLDETIVKGLEKIARESHVTLNIIFQTMWGILLQKYNNTDDVVFGTVVATRPSEIEGVERMVGLFVNTVPVRIKNENIQDFSRLLKKVQNNSVLSKKYEYSSLSDIQSLSALRGSLIDHIVIFENYPIEDEVKKPVSKQQLGFYISGLQRCEHGNYDFNLVICPGKAFTIKFSYNSLVYDREIIEEIALHFKNIASQVVNNPLVGLSGIEILNEEEKITLLEMSRGVREEVDTGKTLHKIFEDKAKEIPEKIAVVLGNNYLSYGELNKKANQLARLLKNKGVNPDTVVGLIVERSFEMIIGILAILKAGGAYLPIDPEYPEDRIKYILEDSGISLLLTQKSVMGKFSFDVLKNIDNHYIQPFRSPGREQITNLDILPIPDRTLVDYEKYHESIGLAPAKYTVSMQTCRGCPYNCLYCHKIWPKKNVVRSAEHIFEEIQYCYNAGVRRFVIIDDIFNLNVENSSRLLRKIIQHGLNIQLFFPNGLRGDILTKEFIDLMVEAGTINMDLALETASPRIQKLIKKNLNLERFSENLNYIIRAYPHVILEIETIHGFPTETEEEAEMTLNFLKKFKWIHFPNLNILKIFPNTELYYLAREYGISDEAVRVSSSRAFHELPETLPFSKSFSRQYQSRFMNEYFLSRDRFLQVLPYQVKILTEEELIQKYDSYLPAKIKDFSDILKLVNISKEDLGKIEFLKDDHWAAPGFPKKIRKYFPGQEKADETFRILLLDLSHFFSDKTEGQLYDVFEEPLGLLYLLSYLNDRFGAAFSGRIAKSRVDFDSFEELKTLISDFKPDVIGVRALSYYKNFYHQTISLIKDWGIDVPIIAGGPYATTDYISMLQDLNIDLAVFGEGEITLGELVEEMMKKNRKLPGEEKLKEIPGIAFIQDKDKKSLIEKSRAVLLLDELFGEMVKYPGANLADTNHASDLVYVIYTSGSTGRPKGVMLEHRNVVNLFKYDFKYTNINFSKLLQFHTIGFDASFHEIFCAFLSGGTLILIDKELTTDIPALLKVVERDNVRTLFLPMSLLRTIFNDEDYIKLIPGCVEHIQSAGEQVIVSDKFKKYLLKNKVYLHNHYGPAETHVVTALTIEPLEEIPGLPPIGKPILNTDIYILDQDSNLVPTGVPGELYIGGVQVGRGYLGKKKLTEERFIINPFNGMEKMYRTGDLARWLPDGNIEFLGRIDNQVKIRGFRVEPGEIESQLLNHEDVQKAVVLTKEDRDGEKHLYAHVVSIRGFSVSELREYLSRNLPSYMIPSYFIKVDNIPLTPNGKIDIRALQSIELKKDGRCLVPRDDIDEKLRGIWSEVLGVNEEIISIDDNFFELGGHSLKATTLIAKVQKEFNTGLTLAEMFKIPTIKGLSDYMKDSALGMHISIEPAEKRDYYPLSSSQGRLYFLQEMDEVSSVYNVPMAVVLGNGFEREKLEDAFRRLIERYENLRVSFAVVDKNPVQRLHEDFDFVLECYDVEEWQKNKPGSFDRRMNPAPGVEGILRNFIRPFDLFQAPLLRVGSIKMENNQQLIILDIHHAITDGISMTILIKDVIAIYSGETLPDLRIQYKDYVLWQRSEKEEGNLKKKEDFWLKEFAGEIPVLNLPTDFIRPSIQSFTGSSLNFKIAPEMVKGIKSLSEEAGATLFIVLLGFLNVLLFRLGNQEDIVVGSPIAGRRHSDLEHVVGLFLNTIALRNYPCGKISFRSFLEDVKEKAINAFDNQEYQFEDLVDRVVKSRDTSRNPLFDVMFFLQNIDLPENEFQQLKIKPYQLERKVAMFDMSWTGAEVGDMLIFTVEYCTKLYKRETIERFTDYFKNIISSILTNPDEKLSCFDMVLQKEKRQILYDFNDTRIDYPQDKTLQAFFEKQVEKTPDFTALVFEEKAMTYRALDEKSNQFARMLKNKYQLKKGEIVAFYISRTIEMLVGIIGTLKAETICLPFDTNCPVNRVYGILEDCGANLIAGVGRLDSAGELERKLMIIGNEELRLFTPTRIGYGNSANCIAYLIYTSGSSGKPKGVLLQHSGIVNHIFTKIRELELTRDDIFCHSLNISFVASIWQIFAPLFIGAKLLIYPEPVINNSYELFRRVQEDNVTVLEVIPSLLNSYLKILEIGSDNINLDKLRQLVLTGEKVIPAVVNTFYEYYNRTELVNAYGQSECSDDTLHCRLPYNKESAVSPVGKPANNTRVYILAEDFNIQPIGVPGELYISGDGLAVGYLNKPERTAEKFVQEPFKGNDRMFRSGDLVRWLPGGNIEFYDRIDRQVKIRGMRIELSEIENSILKDKEINEVVVLEKKKEKGDQYLCAYLVSDREVSISQVHEHLSEDLPDYMIPSYFMQVEYIPRTPNGKIDINALPDPGLKMETGLVKPGNLIEECLLDIWAEVLEVGKDIISIESNFFHLGGHSLRATILTSKIRKELNVKVPISQIFKTPTIRGLSGYIENSGKSKYASIEPVEKREYYVLSSAQKRLYFLHHMNPDGISYNIPIFLLLNGVLDKDRLEGAFKKLIMRHDNFRTSFRVIKEEPVQRIYGDVEFAVSFNDSSQVKTPSEIESEVQDFVKPFDLNRAPLLRVELVKIESERYLMKVDLHHIIADGTSIVVLKKDFFALYSGEELEQLCLQYKDFSCWQNDLSESGKLKGQENYWLNLYSDEIPKLTLPLDFPRTDEFSFKGDNIRFELESEYTVRLKQLIINTGTTLFMNLLAVFNILLYKYCGQDDIIVGTSVFGRPHDDLERIIGMFVNELALRNFVDPDKTYEEFLKEVKLTSVTAFENQDVQFDVLVDKLGLDRGLSKNPIFNVGLVVQNFEQSQETISDLSFTPFGYESKTSKVDMGITASDIGDKIYFDSEYSTIIFKKTTIEKMTSRYIEILKQVIDDPGIKLDDIKIYSDLIDLKLINLREENENFGF